MQCEGAGDVPFGIEVRVPGARWQVRPVLGVEAIGRLPRTVGPPLENAVEDQEPAARPDHASDLTEEAHWVAPVKCTADAGDVEGGIIRGNGLASGRDIRDAARRTGVLKH